ncbi:MAG: hypothetical protein CMM44_05470 [Rhodospirillaceae bacterium]|nr:hypothetical protein [Rhodospirillaceae bacterium]
MFSKYGKDFIKRVGEHYQLFHRHFIHTEAMLSDVEKEMIAAYLSQLNVANYCYSGHSKVATIWE